MQSNRNGHQDDSLLTKKNVALGATAAVAATAAGIAAYRKFGSNGADPVWEVRAHDRGWQLRQVEAEQATRVFETKKEAVRVARDYVASKAPSELKIYSGEDKLLDHHTYRADEA